MTRSAVVPVGLVILGAVLYFPSAEYVIGGKDPGTYINEGVQIAQRGSLIPSRSRRVIGAGRLAGSVFPLAQDQQLLRPAVHGVFHP